MGDSPRLTYSAIADNPEGDKLEKDGERGGSGGSGEKGKTLSEFWDFDKVYLDFYSTGGGIRTPINGFGDRYSTLELHPYFKKVLSF